jgi:hypothetical protein
VSDNAWGLAGDKIVLEHGEGADTIHFGDTGTGRVCGSCTLCCKVVPVPGPPLHKPANVRCKHQRTGKGCTIYAHRPLPCRVFACRWLCDRETAGMPRPDRCHYVIDIKDDYVEAVDNETGERSRVGVIQVWVDAGFRDAHRDPALRAYMLRMAERYRCATIVRFSSREAITVWAPPLTHDGQWHEAGGTIVTRDDADARVMADLERE